MRSKTLDGIKSIENFQIEDKRLFLRLDLNVPMNDDGTIADDTRIRAAMPTIQYAIDKGAKIVMASHFGRPKGVDPKYSLEPVAGYLSENSAKKSC